MKIPRILFERSGEGSNLHLKELQDISNRNIKDAKEFIMKGVDHRLLESKQYSHDTNLSPEDLRKIVLNPGVEIPVSNPIFDLPEIRYVKKNSSSHSRRQKFQPWRKVEYRKQEEIERSLFLAKQQEETSMSRKRRIYFIDSVDDGIIESTLRHSDIRCAMLISDTMYTRNTKFYRDIVKIFTQKEINYVEYTNVQPDLDRRLIFRMAEFAHDNAVNAMFVVGSMSTIDLMKVVMPKIINPNILSLHKKRQWSESLASQYYVFSFPTFVTLEDGVNSRSALKNNVLFPNMNFLGDTIFLNSPRDDSHSVFFYRGVFDSMSTDKVKEVLHEAYFRVLICCFDLSLTQEELDGMVEKLKRLTNYMEEVYFGQELNDLEKEDILRIFSSTLDGSSVVDVEDFWIWYRLESSLSLLVNSRRSHGLALFLPVYMEVLARNSFEFSNRAKELGTKLFQTYSVEGLVLKLMEHIKKYGLPVGFIDIPEIKKVDWRFLMLLVKKSSGLTLFNRLTKMIIRHLTV